MNAWKTIDTKDPKITTRMPTLVVETVGTTSCIHPVPVAQYKRQRMSHP